MTPQWISSLCLQDTESVPQTIRFTHTHMFSRTYTCIFLSYALVWPLCVVCIHARSTQIFQNCNRTWHQTFIIYYYFLHLLLPRQIQCSITRSFQVSLCFFFLDEHFWCRGSCAYHFFGLTLTHVCMWLELYSFGTRSLVFLVCFFDTVLYCTVFNKSKSCHRYQQTCHN